MNLRFVSLLLLPPAFMLLVASCGQGERATHSPTVALKASPAAETESLSSGQVPLMNPALELRFINAVTEYIKTSWSAWGPGEVIAQCFIKNARSMTEESKEAVIEYGIDEAFGELSGVHLQSLSTAWDLCKSESQAISSVSADSSLRTSPEPSNEVGRVRRPLTTPPPIPESGQEVERDPNHATSLLSSELEVVCIVDRGQRKVGCQLNGKPKGDDWNWTSNATDRSGGGTVFEFLVREYVPDIKVVFEACANNSCQTITTVVHAPDLLEDIRSDFGFLQCTTPNDPRPVFTHHVIPMELIRLVIPPGTAASGMLKPHAYIIGTERGGIFGEKLWSGYPRSTPVTTPVTSWLRVVHPYRSTAFGRDVVEPPIEYMLIFEVSCEVYYKLDHVGPLVDKIESMGPFQMGSNHLNTPIKFEAGELVSYSSGVNPGGNVDFGVYNTTVEREFGNQDRYTNGHHDQSLNEDCPFNYFSPELREKYYALFGDESTREVSGESIRSCRVSADSDVPGTIEGAWFVPEGDLEGSWGIHESVFSISTSWAARWVRATFAAHAETGAEFEIQVAPEDATYIEPSKVTSEHCYQSYADYYQKEDPVYVNIELVSPTNLQVEYGTGTCAKRTAIETLRLER